MHLIYKRQAWIIFLGAILFSTFNSGFSQDLVLNGSFELYNADYCNKSLSSNPSKHDSLPAIHWYSVDNGESEYYRSDTVLTNCRVTTELWYNYPELFDPGNALDGNAWMGMTLFVWDGFSERITGQLIESLKEDSLYEITFYTRICEISFFCIKTLGIQFSNCPHSQSGILDPYYSIPKFRINQPDIEFDISETCNSDDWIRIRGLYKAKGGERSFTIGYYYPEGFDWSRAFDKYNTWTLNEICDAYKASKRLVKRAPNIDFSSNYVSEISSHEIAYYFIDSISITQNRNW